MSREGGLRPTILKVGLGGHTAQVPMAVLQLLDGSVGCEMTTVGEEVGAVAFGLDVCSDCVERVFRHEVVKIQLVHLDVGIIGHQLGNHLPFCIEGDDGVALQMQGAVAFTGGEVGCVFGGIGLERAVETDTIGDTVVTHRLGIE